MTFPLESFTLGALVALAITEAIIKPVMVRLTRLHAPAVVGKLMAVADILLPWAIANDKTATEYEEAICLHMTGITGEPWGKADTDAVFAKGFDPRITLEKMK